MRHLCFIEILLLLLCCVKGKVCHLLPFSSFVDLCNCSSPGQRDGIVVVVVVDRFYIALFSALELNHCARM